MTYPNDDLPTPICTGCNTLGHDLAEYIEMATVDQESNWDFDLDMWKPEEQWVEVTPEEVDEWIRSEEGTYNWENGHFLCTMCYIRAGQPSSPRGWTAP